LADKERWLDTRVSADKLLFCGERKIWNEYNSSTVMENSGFSAHRAGWAEDAAN